MLRKGDKVRFIIDPETIGIYYKWKKGDIVTLTSDRTELGCYAITGDFLVLEKDISPDVVK
jgi:hypothetical protein